MPLLSAYVLCFVFRFTLCYSGHAFVAPAGGPSISTSRETARDIHSFETTSMHLHAFCVSVTAWLASTQSPTWKPSVSPTRSTDGSAGVEWYRLSMSSPPRWDLTSRA